MEMKDLIICMVSSDNQRGLMPHLLKQLESAGIEYYIKELPIASNWHTACTVENTIGYLREFAEKFEDYERIVKIDAWDMLFYGTKEELISKIPTDKLILAAEKNCYPDKELAAYMPDGGSPWRFCNGGGLAGTPERFALLADILDSYEKGWSDQKVYNLMLSQRINPFVLNYPTDLFYCFVMDKGDCMIVTDKYNSTEKRPYNKVMAVFPSFIHFNGKCYPLGWREAVNENVDLRQKERKIDGR
jgi:hypothetical protein